MAWTYGAKPDTDDKDAVRLLIGDTDKNDPCLQDEEINYFLSLECDVRLAAARAADSISAKFARCVDEAVGQVRVSYSQQAKAYGDLAARLRREHAVSGARPFAGGISIADKTKTVKDSDRVRPDISRDLHENPDNADNLNTELITREGGLP